MMIEEKTFYYTVLDQRSPTSGSPETMAFTTAVRQDMLRGVIFLLPGNTALDQQSAVSGSPILLGVVVSQQPENHRLRTVIY